MKKFNFNAKRIFLTYPKCTLSTKEIHEKLGEMFPIKEYTIATERHEDGTDHLHVLLTFDSKVHRTSERSFDVQGFHPNIKTVKSQADFGRINVYVRKDGNFITNVVEVKSKRVELAEKLFSQGLSPRFVRDHPEIIFQNYNNLRQWLRFTVNVYSPPIPYDKKRHIWLHGPSNSGKTTWLNALRSCYNTFEIPQNNDYGRILDMEYVEVLYVDEFKGNVTIQDLNRLCDGNTQLNLKGGSYWLKNVWVVVVSNFDINFVYHKSDDLSISTLMNRFNRYDSSINMPAFPKYIIN